MPAAARSRAARSRCCACEKPPAHFYRYLYDTIGGDYFWVDRKKLTPDKLAETIQDPRNAALCSVSRKAIPAGMAELDLRKAGDCNISYFGLMPEAVGPAAGHLLPLSHLHQCLAAAHRSG